MRSANENAGVNQAQRTYTRLAGILLLGAIIIAIGAGAILSNIAGNGTFPRLSHGQLIQTPGNGSRLGATDAGGSGR